jgi:hypothetical protein
MKNLKLVIAVFSIVALLAVAPVCSASHRHNCGSNGGSNGGSTSDPTTNTVTNYLSQQQNGVNLNIVGGSTSASSTITKNFVGSNGGSGGIGFSTSGNGGGSDEGVRSGDANVKVEFEGNVYNGDYQPKQIGKIIPISATFVDIAAGTTITTPTGTSASGAGIRTSNPTSSNTVTNALIQQQNGVNLNIVGGVTSASSTSSSTINFVGGNGGSGGSGFSTSSIGGRGGRSDEGVSSGDANVKVEFEGNVYNKKYDPVQVGKIIPISITDIDVITTI